MIDCELINFLQAGIEPEKTKEIMEEAVKEVGEKKTQNVESG